MDSLLRKQRSFSLIFFIHNKISPSKPMGGRGYQNSSGLAMWSSKSLWPWDVETDSSPTSHRARASLCPSTLAPRPLYSVTISHLETASVWPAYTWSHDFLLASLHLWRWSLEVNRSSGHMSGYKECPHSSPRPIKARK